MSALNRLAVDGGQPQLASTSVMSWPQFTSNDDAEILRAARGSDRSISVVGALALAGLGRHENVARLERRWSRSTGRSDVVACASPTVAVRLLADGFELADGDEVIVPVGAALAGPLLSVGAVPVQVDLDPKTLHLDPQAVDAAITDRTVAVLAVNRFGTTADYAALRRVAERHGIVIVEDGSESIGAFFDGGPVGALGTASISSMHSGQGPAIGSGALFATDDPTQAAHAHRMMLLDDPLAHLDVASWPRDASSALLGSTSGRVAMSEVDAIVAMNRISHLSESTELRAANGTHLRRLLRDVPGVWIPNIACGATHTYGAFPLVVVPDEVGLPEACDSALRDTLLDCMTAEGLWIEATDAPGVPSPGDRFPVAEWTVSGGLVLTGGRSPLEPPNSTAYVERVANCFVKILVDNVDRIRQLAMERATFV